MNTAVDFSILLIAETSVFSFVIFNYPVLMKGEGRVLALTGYYHYSPGALNPFDASSITSTQSFCSLGGVND